MPGIIVIFSVVSMGSLVIIIKSKKTNTKNFKEIKSIETRVGVKGNETLLDIHAFYLANLFTVATYIIITLQLMVTWSSHV